MPTKMMFNDILWEWPLDNILFYFRIKNFLKHSSILHSKLTQRIQL